MHTSEIYRVLELVCSSRRMFPFHRGKAFVDPETLPEVTGTSRGQCQQEVNKMNLDATSLPSQAPLTLGRWAFVNPANALCPLATRLPALALGTGTH